MRSKLKRIAEIFLSLLYGRTILVLTVMFCVVALLAFWYFSRASQALLEAATLNGTAMYAKSLKEERVSR